MEYLGKIILILYIAIIAIILYYWKSWDPTTRVDKNVNTMIQKKAILALFGGQLGYLTLSIFLISPFFIRHGINYFYVSIVISTLLFILIPYLHIRQFDEWEVSDIGIKGSIHTPKLAIFAVLSYIIYGVLRVFVLPPVYFNFWIIMVMIYSNAFVEEFFNRGIIQSKLETIYHPKQAVQLQTLIFTLIHIPVNIRNYLFVNTDLGSLLLAFAFQIIHGFIYGLLYQKTRNLWPSIVCHYFTNWLGPLFFLLI